MRGTGKGIEDKAGAVDAGSFGVAGGEVAPLPEPAEAALDFAIQYFFVARLMSLNLTGRYGPEFSKPERGGYDLDYVPLRDDSLSAIDLKPAVLKEFVLANRDALLAEAGFRA